MKYTSYGAATSGGLPAANALNEEILMRKYALAILATLIIGLAGSLTAPAAQATEADTSPAAQVAEAAENCATRSEFDRVKMHMSVKKVRNIFGYRGERYSIDDERFVEAWFSCKRPRVALVWFKKGDGSYKKRWREAR